MPKILAIPRDEKGNGGGPISSIKTQVGIPTVFNMYISQKNYTYDLFLYTNLIELVYVWFMKMDAIRYRYVPSPLSRGACFCPLSFYYVFARDPLVTLCGHVAFRCNVICCMFVLFKSSVGVGQGFMCHYLALCVCLSQR